MTFTLLDEKVSKHAKKGGNKSFQLLKKKLGSKEAISKHFRELAKKKKLKKIIN